MVVTRAAVLFALLAAATLGASQRPLVQAQGLDAGLSSSAGGQTPEQEGPTSDASVSSSPRTCSATTVRGPRQSSFIKRTAFAGGRLWLLSDQGELSSLREDGERREDAGLCEPVIDLCARGGELVLVTSASKRRRGWTLRRWHRGRWSIDGTLSAHGERLVGMTCSPDSVLLISSGRLIDVAPKKREVVRLSGQWAWGRGGVRTIHATGSSVYIGVNAGEWGGGLRRIDRRTGRRTIVPRNETGKLCEGPLDGRCDPVTGIVADPWKPGCIVAAVGVMHFTSSGRLVEVCANDVETLYSNDGTAFFGLSRVADELWAAANDGIYRAKGRGAFDRVPLPKLKMIGDIAVSFELPNMIVVLTDVNRRRSVSGSVPLLVPR